MPGNGPTGVIRDRPYTPGDAPSVRLPRGCDAVRLMWRAVGRRFGSPRPDPRREPDDSRSGRPGRCRERGHHGPALRVADQLRRRPPGPPGARRIVAVQRRWTPGDVPSAPGPDLLGRQPAAPVRCDPQLVAPDRSGASVATRLARPGHRRRRRVPAGNGDRSRDRRPPRRRRIRRPRGRPGPTGDRFRQHRRRADVLGRPARSGGGRRGPDRRARTSSRAADTRCPARRPAA